MLHVPVFLEWDSSIDASMPVLAIRIADKDGHTFIVSKCPFGVNGER